MVRNSVKPWPTFPSAKYQIGLTGPEEEGIGVPVGVGVGVLVLVGVGVGVLVLVGVGVGVLVLVGVGVGVFVGDGHGVGLVIRPGSASANLWANSSLIHTLSLLSTAKPSCGCELLVIHSSMTYILNVEVLGINEP
jgi:hypothetical protein